ncbi:Clp1-interacting protein Nsk1 [Schizosaccharomyces octosporus yFS286]|uniref:Clp1-interacting protein Nsk1 n=1 Tax=Schizosaccharomyces octosporus (strain yFS286) TaxID=483514 RepID=S9PQ81_SCHOY|nr:Clp1-interacting protein Nsk1 [Schizosaccharomyces octosporus yFS286]EPX71391.1 Clp1-interacting protein Nsk1 [Schizosaccharomyces octosporus yFS286]
MSVPSRFSITDITPFLTLPSVPLSSVPSSRTSFHSSLASSPLRILSPFKPPSSSLPRVASPTKITSPTTMSSLQEKTSTPIRKVDLANDDSPSPKTFGSTKTFVNEQKSTSSPKVSSNPSLTSTPPGILEQDHFFSARSKRKNNLFFVDENGSSRVVLGTPSRVPSPTKTGSMLNSPPSRVELTGSPKSSVSSIRSSPLRSPIRSSVRTPLSPPSRKRLRAKNEPISPTPASPSPPPKLPSILGRPRRLAAMEASPAIRKALISSRQTKPVSEDPVKKNTDSETNEKPSPYKNKNDKDPSGDKYIEKPLQERNVETVGMSGKFTNLLRDVQFKEKPTGVPDHHRDSLSKRKHLRQTKSAQLSPRQIASADSKPVNTDTKKYPPNPKRKVKWSKKLVQGSSDTEPTSPSRPSKVEPSKSCLASKLRE